MKIKLFLAILGVFILNLSASRGKEAETLKNDTKTENSANFKALPLKEKISKQFKDFKFRWSPIPKFRVGTNPLNNKTESIYGLNTFTNKLELITTDGVKDVVDPTNVVKIWKFISDDHIYTGPLYYTSDLVKFSQDRKDDPYYNQLRDIKIFLASMGIIVIASIAKAWNDFDSQFQAKFHGY